MNENPTLNFALTINEINAILGALQELPAKVANPLSQKIREQAEAQIKQMQEEADVRNKPAVVVNSDE